MNKYITEEDTEIANQDMEICSKSLAIKKMQDKITIITTHLSE